MSFDGLPRLDFPSIDLPRGDLIEFNKKLGKYKRIGEGKAKPDGCALCGSKDKSFCNSHSIPQFCLRAIAVDGKVRTLNSSVGFDFLHSEEGINNTGTFRMICRECDSRFFSEYENPDLYYKNTELNNNVLSKIVIKVCLLEQYKARVQVALLNAVYDELAFGANLSNMVNVRQQDQSDDAIQFVYANNTLEGFGKGYRILFDVHLDYTVPIAFQGQIALVSDFAGKAINDVFNYSPEYRIEPMYICIFPLESTTRIVAFCRDAGYARYAKFHRGLRSKGRNKALMAIMKIVLCYSEEVYFSPLLPVSVFNDQGFEALAKMSNMRMSLFGELQLYNRNLKKQACEEYALDNLPEPPNLLLKEYSISNLNNLRNE